MIFSWGYFVKNFGLFQEESQSPILLSIYINHLENDLFNNCTAIEFCNFTLLFLMYADDTVLLSESPAWLQVMLNELSNYCDKWKQSVNIDKTKIVIFRNGGIIRENEKWETQYKRYPILRLYWSYF